MNSGRTPNRLARPFTAGNATYGSRCHTLSGNIAEAGVSLRSTGKAWGASRLTAPCPHIGECEQHSLKAGRVANARPRWTIPTPT